MARQTALPTPVPKGRNLVIGLLALAVVVAVIVQFATSMGPGQHVKKRIEEERRVRPVAAPAPVTSSPVTSSPVNVSPTPATPGRRPELVPEVGSGNASLPFEAPGANLPVPEGLSDRSAGRLRLSLAGLREAQIIAVSAVKDLAAIVEEAPEADRAILRPFVIERLAALAGNPRLGIWALDAGLLLAAGNAEDLGALAETARNPGLLEDRTTAAALLLLEALVATEREATVAAVWKLVRDDARPVHLRVLAARTLTGWDALPEKRAALAQDGQVAEPIRQALRAP